MNISQYFFVQTELKNFTNLNSAKNFKNCIIQWYHRKVTGPNGLTVTPDSHGTKRFFRSKEVSVIEEENSLV